jgi:hypothetical protein
MAEWIAYDRLEPIGEERADFRVGLLCSMMVNIAKAVWGDSKQPVSPLDYMPRWDGGDVEDDAVPGDPPAKPRQSVEDMKLILETLAKSSGVIKKKGKDAKSPSG